MKVLLITQARSGSTRLPGKVHLQIEGESLLDIHLKRLKESKLVSAILVATTTNPEDERIYDGAIKQGYLSYRGSEQDVLDRFYQAARLHQPEWIVRVTSDCPLLDPVLVDDMIQSAIASAVDYFANILEETFPDGQDIEVFTFKALERAWKEATLKSEREHVTPYIRENSTHKGGTLFRSHNYACHADFSAIRMTVDEQKDFDLIRTLVTALGTSQRWEAYVDYMIENNLTVINADIVRNAGYLKSLREEKKL